MSQSLVSVIMPAYNAARFIAAAIESVLAQSYTSWELVVVDDGSTDDTSAIVRSYGPRVRYVRQENARQAAARNRGLEHARGELLAFIDADDVWRADKLERQVALLEGDPGLGLVYCGMQQIDEAGQPGGYLRPQLRGWAMSGILLGRSRGGLGGMGGSTALIPRSVLRAVGDFDVRLPPCEDTDLFWRIAARYPVDYVDEPLVQYRIHAGNAHRDLERTTRAWKLLYDKALHDHQVRRLGVFFGLRCRGRLYYMLAGDHARAGRLIASLGYGLRAVLFWPPALWIVLRQALRRLRGLGP